MLPSSARLKLYLVAKSGGQIHLAASRDENGNKKFREILSRTNLGQNETLVTAQEVDFNNISETELAIINVSGVGKISSRCVADLDADMKTLLIKKHKNHQVNEDFLVIEYQSKTLSAFLIQ